MVCPNKSSKEWKSLVEQLGEDRAMLSFIRNNSEIPSFEKARELLTNREALEDLQKLPLLKWDELINVLNNDSIIYGEPVEENGRKWYPLNQNIDISNELAKYTDKYGSVLEYKGDYVTINEDSLNKWNSLATYHRSQSKSLTDLCKDFLSRIGVKILEQDDLIKKYGSNGIADFAERMVQIQSGKMDVALPEEAMHFFLDMLPQDNEALIEALDKVRTTSTYKSTLAKYKNNPNYRTPDGKVRFDKIRKEALAKELANEMKKKEKRGWLQTLIDMIMSLINKVKVKKDSFEILQEMFFSGEMELLNTNLKSSEIYNQLTDEEKNIYESQPMNDAQKATLQKIVAYVAKTGFNKDSHKYIHADFSEDNVMNSVTTIIGSDFISELEDPSVLMQLSDAWLNAIPAGIIDTSKSNIEIAEQVKDFLINNIVDGTFDKSVFEGLLNPRLIDLLFKASEATSKRLFGTGIHTIVENLILGNKIDFDNPEHVSPDVYRLIDRKSLESLIFGDIHNPGIMGMLREIKKDGSVIMSEISISNGKIGGQLDIIVIKPDGTVDIYDFKTKFLKNFGEKPYVKEGLVEEFHSAINKLSPTGVLNDPTTLKELVDKQRSNKQKYGQQLSIYKKMLMEAGVRVGSLNVIGVPYRLDNTTKKVTEVRPELIENVTFNSNLASYYFPNLDTSNDASIKEEVKIDIRDTRLDNINKIKKEKLKEAFVKAYARLIEIGRKFEKNKDQDNLFKALEDVTTKSNKVSSQRLKVKTALDLFEDFDNITPGQFANMQKSFLDMIDSSVPIIEQTIQYFESLKELTPTSNAGASQRLSEMMKIRDFLTGYRNMFEDLLGYMPGASQNNPVYEKLSQLVGLISSVNNDYVTTITPMVSDMLLDVFNKDSLNTIVREYNELIAAAKVRKDFKRAEVLKEERDNLPSEKVIAELLKGDRGDAGVFWSRVFATIGNPDIILAGAAKKLKASLDRVRLENKKVRDDLSKQLQKRWDIYGQMLDVKTLNQSLTYVVDEFNVNTGKSMNVLYFKSEFDERLYSDYNKKVYALKKAQEGKNKSEITKARKDLKDFEKRYLQTGFTDEYYRMTKPLDTKVMYQGVETTIREINANLQNRILQLENEFTEEEKLNGAFNPDYLKRLQEITEEKASIREKVDERGNPKTGDALKIANILEQYDIDKKNLYEFVEQTEFYERSREKAKLKYGEDSEQFKLWEASNTRIVISDEFYKKRDELFKERAEILGTQSDEISDLYKQLRNLTGTYKDKDGYVRGTMLSKESAKKLKEIETRLEYLKDTSEVSIFNGYTREEKNRVDALYYAKNNGFDYSQRELDELREKAQQRIDMRMLADPDFAKKLKRLKEINDEIFSMSKKERTKYYDEELEKQMQMFADSRMITMDQLKQEGTYLEEFKESEWYMNNHIIKVKVLYEDEDGRKRVARTDTPTSQWLRSMPVEKYIEIKPGSHFVKSVQRDFYINEKGQKILLRDPNNLDVKNRFKPKTNEAYRKEYGVDHPYLNKDFVELRNRVNNGTADQMEKVDYENLIYISSKMLESQQEIELSQRLGLAVPFLEKQGLERTIETKGENITSKTQSRLTSFGQYIKRAFTRTDQDVDQTGIPTQEADSRNDIAKLATMDNEEIKYVPVRFSTKGEAENASYNVWGGVLGYLGSVTRKKELEKDLAFINGLESILGDKANQPKTEQRNLILNNIYKKYIPELEAARINKGTNIRLDTLKSFVNSVMYNEEYFQGIDVLGVNSQKAVNALMGLSSFTMLGAAPLNWATNWISGNIQNMVEGIGGKLYTMKEYGSAHSDIYGSGKYGSAIKDLMSDYTKVGMLSFWGQIMEYFDPIQGEFENEYGQKTNFNKAKNILQLGLFAGKVWGEWEIQMKSFIAFMKNVRLYDGKMVDKEDFITLKIGTDVENLTPREISELKLKALEEWDSLDVNLLDLFEQDKEGVLVVKDEYKNVFQLGSSEFSNIIGKLHAMQKRLNGSYAKFDRSYAEKTSLGRMAFFFRKYFLPIGVNRWGERRADYESMSPEQGFYITFIQSWGKDLVKFNWNNLVNWENYSDFEKRAIKRTLADIAIVLSIIAVTSLLLGWDPDDPDRFKKLKEKNWAHRATLFILLKVKSETEQFLPYAGLDEIKGVYSNPSLLFNETTRYIKISKLLGMHLLDATPFFNFEGSLYYKKDVDQSGLKDKGDAKIVAEFMRSFVGYTGRTIHPEDALKAFENLQKR
jgi:hypothetical protein